MRSDEAHHRRSSPPDRHPEGGERKKVVGVSTKRTVVKTLVEQGRAKVSEICRAIGLPRSSFYARTSRSPESLSIEQRAIQLSKEKPRYGYRRITALLRREGLSVNPNPMQPHILKDEIGCFHLFHAGRKIKETYRKVVVWLEDKQEELVLLTNRLDLAASTIAEIYRQRWQIELFFKAIKQNLKIKTFVGTSANAVKIQIWTALISMLLLKMLQHKSKMDWALSNLVALLRWNLFTYKNLWQWIDNPFQKPPDPPPQSMLPTFGTA